MSLLSRFFGDSPPPTPTLDLADGAEDGWADCAFEADWRGQTVRARARHQGEVVGFDVDWPRDWVKIDFGPDAPFTGFRATLTLRSCGVESDRFVAALAERASVSGGPATMLDTVSCTGISLDGDPRLARQQDVRVKLFFFENDEDRYAEAFLNVVARGRRLELNEKDADYRPLILGAFTGG
jgi:hypothetical protein